MFKKKIQCTLEKLIKGINHGVNEAADIDDHLGLYLAKNFDYDKEKDLYSPKILRFKVGDRHVVEAARCLFDDLDRHALDETEMEFDACPTGFVNDKDYPSNIPQIELDIAAIKKNKNISFGVKFRREELPDALLKLKDIYLPLMTPTSIK